MRPRLEARKTEDENIDDDGMKAAAEIDTIAREAGVDLSQGE